MRPSRSLLYVPAGKPAMLDKVAALGADHVVLDLEDGVAPTEKARAREHVRGRSAEPAIRAALIRVNPPGSPWHADDLSLVRELRPAGVLVPKTESIAATRSLAEALAADGRSLWLTIETAAGVARVRDLAALPGVAGLVVGSADLRRSLGARPRGEDRGWELHALSEVLLAARLVGCRAIDSVHFHFRDHDGLRRHAEVARALGYDGKSCIHPGQIPPIHEVFGPSDDEVAWARAVLAAWDEAEGARRGVIVVAGEMIEALHVEVAQRILSAWE